jgi:CRP/FNR family transcriptional regulator, cyclic AMP receptor protein
MGSVSWSILEGLPDDDRRRVLGATRRRRFGRRETLFHEGDLGETVHLIDRGRVAVRVTTPLGDIATLNVRGAGDVVGELALLDAAMRRTASVIALEPTETLALHRDEFADIRKKHPSVDRFLVAILAAEVERLSVLLAEALYLPVDTRVLRRLVDLAHLYRSPDGGAVEIPFTQEELGTIAGASRATVNRVLGETEAAGSIDVRRGRIVVNDLTALERRAL